ncbi:TolC family protein [Zunongwangia endophytica]|uniref:TolC family protein n=1 Tax=Zunongwangia endophytica TaxID=1808945 RepID=A0ABV8HBS9_9FLAO|nr:TolC family protein [Zunongwangia endophytica]MDN3596352.1 TolC family protein [Zunongwangia endophytica]
MLTKKTYKILPIWMMLLFSFATEAQQLEAYIQEAQESNPMVEAIRAKYDISKEQINAVNSLPNTEFSAGYFVSEPETRTGPQQAKFSVKQMLPWFGTISAKQHYASSLAEEDQIEVETALRKLRLSVSSAYFQLYEWQKKIEVVQENIDLLRVYEELALNGVEVGKAGAVDILKLQMQQNKLKDQLINLQNNLNAEKVAFNRLLNKENNASVAIIDTLLLPGEEAKFSAIKIHPELSKLDKTLESIDFAEAINQKEAAPQFGLGLDYINVGTRTDMAIPDNGKDIVMPMISFSVPIFNHKYSSVTAQNKLRKKQVSATKNQRLNELESRLSKALENRNSARNSVEIQLRNIELTKDAEAILMRSYESETLDFRDVLDIQEMRLEYQMKLAEAVSDYFKQAAMVEYLVD